MHVNDVGADSVHEILGVRHHQQDSLELAQHFLQPDTGLQIQVIGGLIQDPATSRPQVLALRLQNTSYKEARSHLSIQLRIMQCQLLSP